MSDASYARQLLAKNKTIINTGDEEIGRKEESVYEGRPELPFFETGTKFFDDQDIIDIRDYAEIQTRGFVIESIPIPGNGLLGKNFGAQRVNYVLVRVAMAKNPKSNIPKDHYAQFDQKNHALRLVGPNAGKNGVGNWTYLQPPMESRTRKMNPASYSEKSDMIIERFMSRSTGQPPAPKKIYLRELPVMITEDNEIVCIEQGNDEPRIGAFGQTGSGKSIGLHGIADMAFQHPLWHRKLAILNDVQAENDTWCLPNDNMNHAVILARLGLTPKPLPILYLHPHIREHYDKYYGGDVGFDISLPYKQIVENFKDFFDLGASEKYFNTHMKEILSCKSKEQLLKILDSAEKMEKGTKNKILATLGQIYELQITDVNTKAPSAWTVIKDGKERRFNPVTACFYAGVIPCLETRVIDAKTYFPQYFKLIAGDIYYRQVQDPEFRIRSEKVWLFTDEILSVAEKGKVTVASDLLTLCFTQGRIKGIGMMIATQNFGKLPDRIKSNLDFLFFFSNPSEAGAIVNAYQLPKAYKNKIAKLKKFECVAYSTVKFIVYDKDGRRREDRGPFVGIVVPPQSLHKRPAKKKDEFEGED